MTNQTVVHEIYPDPHHDIYTRTIFGFWIYLLTDFILFGTFFATYAVLRYSTYGGPSGREIFNIHLAFAQTLILLTCSFTSGMGGALAHRKNKSGTLSFFALTFLLGLVFLGLEFSDLTRLINDSCSWKRSAFLSAFFTLVGTLVVHMIFALAWVVVLLVPIWREGLTSVSIRRLTCLRMFWQFLTVIWIYVFAIVYLMR